MPRSRKGRSFSPAELDRFIAHLTATGNMTLAAEAIGRPVRSLQNRRRYDPAFNSRCEAALALFRATPPDPAHRVPRAGRRPATQLRATGGEYVVIRGGPHRGAQLRRAKPGQLTDAALALYLRTVAATANLDLSARSIGISSHAIADRRRRDVAFDQQVVEALKEGCQRLETQLLESALRGLRDRAEDEEDDLSEEVEAAASEFAPRLSPMNAYEALLLLQKQRELLSRPRRWSAERDREILKLATARLEQALKRFTVPREKSKDELGGGVSA